MSINGLSIAIPTLGYSAHLGSLLNSILYQTFDLQLEVIIVTQNQFEEVERLIEDMDQSRIKIRHFFLEKQNVNKARNMAAALANFDIVYFLDDDCTLNRNDHLINLISYYEKNADVNCVGGSYSTLSRAFFWTHLYNTVVNLWAIFHDGHQVLMPAGNLSAKRGLLLAKPFDENLDFGGEELDWLIKIQREGRQVIRALDLNVTHQCENSLKHVYRKAFYHGQAKKRIGQSECKKKPRVSLKLLFSNIHLYQLPFLWLYLVIDKLGFVYHHLFQMEPSKNEFAN